MSRDDPCAVSDGRGVLAEPGNGHNAIAGLQNHHVAGYSDSYSWLSLDREVPESVVWCRCGQGIGLAMARRFAAAGMLEAAVEAGAVRADISATDLLYALAHLYTPVPGEGLAHSQRMVGVLIDGLRSCAGQERS